MTTAPKPISQFAPNNSGDRTDFTDKVTLENVSLVITGARTAKGKNGVFWIVEAVRKDTGESVVFTGSTVIDQTMAAVKEQAAFPVAAMLVKIQPEEPGANWYWNLIDPPDTTAPKGRIAEVGEFLDRKVVTVDDVQVMCKDIAKTDAKVNDLNDEQYAELLNRLRELEASAAPPPEDPPF